MKVFCFIIHFHKNSVKIQSPFCFIDSKNSISPGQVGGKMKHASFLSLCSYFLQVIA